jgi:methionine-S-sulfoxide reductase
VFTEVGYSGGDAEEPSYHRIGDHSETVRLRYDPSVITFPELLEYFWNNHDPYARSFSRQYRAVLFYHDESQRLAAEESLRNLEKTEGKTVQTALEPVKVKAFYPAEDYHQKYYLQGDRGIFEEFRRMYPQFADLVASTAAAKVNGYLGGWGSGETIRKNLPFLGLSEGAGQKLLKRAGRFR